MAQETKGNILIISHQERILNIADKIIYLKAGRVEKYAARDEILPEILKSTGGGVCQVMTDKLKED